MGRCVNTRDVDKGFRPKGVINDRYCVMTKGLESSLGGK